MVLQYLLAKRRLSEETSRAEGAIISLTLAPTFGFKTGIPGISSFFFRKGSSIILLIRIAQLFHQFLSFLFHLSGVVKSVKKLNQFFGFQRNRSDTKAPESRTHFINSLQKLGLVFCEFFFFNRRGFWFQAGGKLFKEAGFFYFSRSVGNDDVESL